MGEKKSVVGGGYLFITFQKRGGIGTVLINNQKRARWQYLKKEKEEKMGNFDASKMEMGSNK